MANESQPNGGQDPVLPRTREPGTIKDDGSSRLSAFFERRRHLRWLLAFVAAAMAGVLLVPTFGTRNVPTDPDLLGTPASENIKAARDMVVEDEATTDGLRDDAVERVRRVYDFDVGLGDKLAERVRAAFRAGRQPIEAYLDEHPELAEPQKLSRQERRVHEEAIEAAAQRGKDELVESLGVVPDEADVEALADARYDPAIQDALATTLETSLDKPVVDNPRVLERDRDQGITTQRIPDDGSERETIENVEAVQDLASLQAEMPARVRDVAPDLDAQHRALVTRLARRLVQPNLTPNRAATELARAEARLNVKPATIVVKKGEMIIRDGERFTRRHLLTLEQMAATSRTSSSVLAAIGAGLLVLLLTVAAFRFVRRLRRGRKLEIRDALFLTTLFIIVVGVTRLWLLAALALSERYTAVPLEALLFAIPVAGGAMITRLVLRLEMAVIFAVISSAVLGLMVDAQPLIAVYALVGALLGATVIRTINARGDVLRAGVWVGVGQVLAALGLLLFEAKGDVSTYLIALPTAFIGGTLASFVALALTPLVEAAFGYTTDLKLLELANLNHPALKELIVQAPGSYHHSIIVGALVEAAAEAIGANPLLGKVMAYYHDLGKGCNAAYFIENQRGGNNPHDKLKPSMSAMVIRRHVTDGLEIAKRYGLGELILAGVLEHHGTTLIQYFYAKAKEAAGPDDVVSESDYRYPGRKPQTRESALVMLGDSVEAASRSLADPSPARIQGLVNKIINTKFTDGQLEECDLTLRDMHTIARRFIEVLTSIYHQRVAYPEMNKKKDADTHPKPAEAAAPADGPAEEDRPDNIRRLGL